MPGPWTPADVGAPGTRPGLYINFQNVAAQSVGVGTRGIVGILSEADWGPANLAETFASWDEAVAMFTATENATSRLANLVRMAFLGGAQTVKAVRVMKSSNAVKALNTLVDTTGSPVNVITITAKYFGLYGNKITYDVLDDPIDATKTRIRIFVDGVLVHSVTSTTNHGSSGFIDNFITLFTALASPWVVVAKLATGNNDLADVASSTALATGANGDTVTTTEYTAALALFDNNKIHILTSDTVVSGIRTVIKSWAEAKRAEGYAVMAVIGSALGDSVATSIAAAQALNSPAMVYVSPGAIMPNTAGTSSTYPGAATAAMVAGMVAGEQSDHSVTYKGLPTSTNVEISLSNANIIAELAAGVLVISSTPPGLSPGARIERGLTTLYSPSVTDIASYKNIRTVRTMDSITEGLTDAANVLVIGNIPNDDNGKAAVLGMFKDFLTLQAAARTIKGDFTVRFDSAQNNDGEQLFVLVGLKPVAVVEFIFAKIAINS